MKTPEKRKSKSEDEAQASDSDDVAIIDTPPNKYNLRSNKESSDDEIASVLNKSPDSPWKSTPKVKPKHVKPVTPTKVSKSSTPSKQESKRNSNKSSTQGKQVTQAKGSTPER